MDKIIHQTWKTNEIPEKMLFCVRSWKLKNPNYKYMFWTDSDIDSFIDRCYPQYNDLLKVIKYGIQKADIFRILALYHYGGIYVDIDFECLTPIDTWNLDCTKINIANEPIEHHKKDVLCNALIYSPKEKDCLLKILDHGKEVIKKNPGEVMKSFGPVSWQTVLGNSPDIKLIESNLVYPLPDITINQNLEGKYLIDIKRKDFGDSWAVHYWEHSNWPRTNILNKFNNYLKFNNNFTKISFCGIFRNNEKYLDQYLIPKLTNLEKLMPEIIFSYYFYQNDSNDNTHFILDKFMKSRNGKYLSENNNIKFFERNTSYDRISNINNCRNKLLSLGPFEGEWTIFIDSDIEFQDNLINRFISLEISSDTVGVTCNGVENNNCRNCKDSNHYYDTLALVFKNNESGFSHFKNSGPKSCPFKDVNDINKWNNNNLVEVNSAFGGLAFYRSDVINKEQIKYNVGYHKDKVYCCEHIGFNNLVTKFGKLFVNPNFIVRSKSYD